MKGFVESLDTIGPRTRLSITDMVVEAREHAWLITADVHWVLTGSSSRVLMGYQEQFTVLLSAGRYLVVSAPLTLDLMCVWMSEGSPDSWMTVHATEHRVLE